MTKQDKPDEQGDALTPGAIATMREMGWTEAQIEAQRQAAERIRAAGGFPNWVAMCEAARIASEARGYMVPPENFKVVRRFETEAERLADIAQDELHATSPQLWAWDMSAELMQRNPGMDYAAQCVAEAQIMRAFAANANTLPLRQMPSGLPWPKGELLPPKWREGLYMTKAELRAWAKEHAPDLLGSALLAAETTRGTIVNWDDIADVSIPGGMRLISKRRALDTLLDSTLGPIPEATMDGAIRKSQIPAFASLIGTAPDEELTKDERDWLELTWNMAELDWPEHPTKAEWETRYLAAFRQAAGRPEWTPVSTWGLNQKIAERGRELTRQRYEADVFNTMQEYGCTGFAAPQGQGGHWNIEDVKAAVARMGSAQTAPAGEAATESAPREGLKTAYIASAFSGIFVIDGFLAMCHGLSDSRHGICRGSAGGGRGRGNQRIHNPVFVATYLREHGAPIDKLNRAFQDEPCLEPWRAEWTSKTSAWNIG
ncbi:MAG: hypothetical protein HKL99_12845 [Burkholderiales bacterium]|nr:hypothetical protein [Burkholderiales bacterium]